MNASVEALIQYGVKKIAIATAYMDKINQSVRRYYEDAGFLVAAIRGLEVTRPVEQAKLPEYASYKVARDLFREAPSVDAIVVQGRWRSVAYVEELERDTERAVISTTAASLWWALQELGMKAPVRGYGQLLR
jgi:maleate cis-trans isomerase